MNALAVACLALAAVLWLGAALLVLRVLLDTRALGLTWTMGWRRLRPDVVSLLVTGALFGVAGAVLAWWG